MNRITSSAARIRRPLHRFFTARRGPFARIHRWLSLGLLLWIAVESLSGATIVFAGEIDHVWNSDHFEHTAGDVGLTEATKAARTARPGDLVRLVQSPEGEESGGVYWIYTYDAAGHDHIVLVDPGTGEVTATDHELPSLVRFMQRVHFDLNSSSIFGFTPIKVLAWAAVLWLAILLSGFYVWYWPGVKRWARAVRVRRSRGAFTWNMDLHKAIGIVVLVPLSLVVVTGIDFGFPSQVRGTWDAVTLGSYHQPDVQAPLSTRMRGATAITGQQAIEIVKAVDPSVQVSFVTGPGGSPVGVWAVGATVDGSFFGMLGGERDVEFVVDQYSGSIISIEDPADAGFANEAYDSWSAPVHFGTFGGTTTKVLWVLLGVAPAVLGWTGIRMWLVRRSKRTRRAPGAADPDGPRRPTAGAASTSGGDITAAETDQPITTGAPS